MQHSVAISDQKERQVQRDEQADHKLKGVLPNAEGLCGDELGCLCQSGRQPNLQGVKTGQAKTRQQRGGPWRQRIKYAVKKLRRIELARLQALVNGGRFARQRGGYQCQWQNHNDQHSQQGDQRRHVGPTLEPR
ncbi:hypothetical protein GALL_449140 [mine drainage metagenome]|uniref:Uncharacterized protein n=1 Tax=mine drainage metagenome TaxID=410659 RepID=A0A1J5PPD9_9ZZZZ